MWFALMRGPEAETRRVEFETWLAADPAHRQAYSHISEVFSLGKGLKSAVKVPDARRPAGQPMVLARMMGSPVLVLLLLLVSIPMLVGLTAAAMRAIGPGHPLIQADGTGRAGRAEASLATSPGEVRAFRLADGSRVILDADSARLDSSARILTSLTPPCVLLSVTDTAPESQRSSHVATAKSALPPVCE